VVNTSRTNTVVAGRAKPLDVPGAAEYLGVGERFIRRLVNERRVPFHRIGRRIRFKVEDLDRLFEEARVEPAQPLLKKRGA